MPSHQCVATMILGDRRRRDLRIAQTRTYHMWEQVQGRAGTLLDPLPSAFPSPLALEVLDAPGKRAGQGQSAPSERAKGTGEIYGDFGRDRTAGRWPRETQSRSSGHPTGGLRARSLAVGHSDGAVWVCTCVRDLNQHLARDVPHREEAARDPLCDASAISAAECCWPWTILSRF